ncbi:MAG: hypothetical protein NTY04_02740 [Candidatus Staskawiczbacteria bacterium]|nr:hypothetical protein [Candidatus Staskawiczbacteria bacterium]
MIKNYKKKSSAGLCLLVFLCFGCLCIFTSNAFAADLEVNYPSISGQTLNASTTLPDYVKYLFNGGMFVGFFSALISLIAAGVMYLLSPIRPELITSAKDRISGAISGALLLALIYLIIVTINPQLSFLNLYKPAPVQNTSTAKKTSGVYFYAKTGCSDKNVQPSSSDIADLGSLKNKINSVGMQQDANNGALYVSILYANPNFWGKCQYLDPNQSCQTVSPFAESASIYQYNSNPNGDGIYFYRKPCFNNMFSTNAKNNMSDKTDQIYKDSNNIVAYCNTNSGGYYKITNNEILHPIGGGAYEADLNSLKFINVPDEQKNCVKYNDDGLCAKTGKEAPSLGGNNISSIIINGEYIVLFVYRAPQDKKNGPWTFCQEFPAVEDVNKLGPRQMKWQSIMNNGGVVPNYVIVIPVQNN